MDPIVDTIRLRYLNVIMQRVLEEYGGRYDNVDHMYSQLTWKGNTKIEERLKKHREYVGRDSLTVPELYLDPLLPSHLDDAIIDEVPYLTWTRGILTRWIRGGYQYLRSLLLNPYPMRVESAITTGRATTSLDDRRDVSLTSDEFISLFINPDMVGSQELDSILIFSLSVNDMTLRHVWDVIPTTRPDRAISNRVNGTLDRLFDEIWTIPRFPPIRRILTPTSIESDQLTEIRRGMILIRPPVLQEQSERMVELIDDALKKIRGMLIVTYADVWNSHYFNYMMQSRHLEYFDNRINMTIFVLSSNK